MAINFNRMFIDDEIRDSVMEVLESGRYVKGPKSEELETEFADLVGAKYAISCSSGSTTVKSDDLEVDVIIESCVSEKKKMIAT